MKSNVIHGQAYEYYSWEKLGEDVFTLAKQVIASGEHFDRLVALAKGGLTFSRSMVDYLAIPELSTIQIEFYTGIGTTAATPVITQSLPVSIKDQRVLVFDDIIDKGETMKLAKQYLQYHGAKEVKTAALIQKPWTTVKADFFARPSEAWVIFPNEARETIKTLEEKWQAEGDSPSQIRQQLLQIGFSQDEVALFANLK
jgi:uncharacterized protein